MYIPMQVRLLLSLLSYVGIFIVGYEVRYAVDHINDKDESGNRRIFKDPWLQGWTLGGLALFAIGGLLSKVAG
jgi:hypothetical protein